MVMRRSILAVLTAVLLAPGVARAQATDAKLSDALTDLYGESIVDSLVAFLRAGIPIDIVALERQLLPAFQINDLLGNQLSSFPLGSSAGGFTWTFDPSMGTYNRASNTFGPTFTERALTVGRNRFNFGVNYQRVTFDQIEGSDLDGDIAIYTGALGLFFEDRLDLEVTTNTLGLFGTYGVTDRLDIGVAIPIVRVDLDATLTSRFGTSSGGLSPTATPVVYETSDTASGIGDIVVRGKYNFWVMPGGGLAGGVDLRLPTGDELDLLGIAGTQAKFYVAASTAYNRLSPHVNFGFTLSGESEAARDPDTNVFTPPNEINFAGGTDVAVNEQLTVSGDLIGRTLRDIGRLRLVSSEFGSNFREFTLEDGHLNTFLGAVGAKYNPFPNALFSANVLFPLNNSGLTDKLTWVLGFDYSF